MITLLSIDPGKATGWALGKFTPSAPYRLVSAGITHDGLQGFLDWFKLPHGDDVIVCEKFILRNNGFVPDTTPLLIEGALSALVGINRVNWQLRSQKSIVPDALLKNHGLWLTGRDVGHEDARDAMDAIIHALAWLARQKHRPTLEKYFDGK